MEGHKMFYKARLNGATFWDIIRHCWAQHFAFVWTPCWDMSGNVGSCWTMLDEDWFLSNFSSNTGQHFSSSMRIWEHSLVLSLSAYVIVTHCHHFTICDRVFNISSRTVLLKKTFSSLLLMNEAHSLSPWTSTLVLPLFRLGSSSSSINSIKTAAATIFRFFHNWETAMFLCDIRISCSQSPAITY